jgi:PleD family two-component response regulator
LTRTVLLVDDDLSFRNRVAPALEARGLRVVQASFARDADRLLARERPSVLVVDGLLPDAAGAAWLARQPIDLRPVPIVFVSSSARTLQSYQEACRGPGAQLVLRKPIPPHVLAEQVMGLLERSEPPQVPEAIPLEPHNQRELALLLETAARAAAISRAFRRTANAVSPQPPRRSEPAGQRPARRRPRVLLVDDDRAHLEALRELLADRFEVTIASGADEARKRVQAPRPEAIVIEAAPDGRHAAIARQLRALPQLESIPLAFAHAERPPDAAVAAWAGASLSLPRSRDPQALEAALRALLSRAPKARLRALLVDASPTFRGAAVRILRDAGVAVATLASPHRLAEALEKLRPDALLLEAAPPELFPHDLCRSLRAKARFGDLPVLFVASSASPEDRAAAYRAGADDYLTKPLLRIELAARVRVHLERARLLRERALRDGVTGLWQRGPFLEEAAARLAASEALGEPFSVALFSLRDLAALDAKDAAAPDRLMAAAGRLLRERLRAEDVRGRFRDGVLAVALPGKDLAAARALAQLAVSEMSALEVPTAGDRPLRCAFEAAVASAPEGGRSLAELLASARGPESM